MTVDMILHRLDKLTATGKGRWMACCPAHQDRSPSLSVREAEDGRVLMHCFAGCDVHDICAAIGLEVADLFPDSGKCSNGQRIPQLSSWKRQRLEDALAHSRLLLTMATAARERGETLSASDVEAVKAAAERIPRLEAALKQGGRAA
jgi:hypothetical protein